MVETVQLEKDIVSEIRDLEAESFLGALLIGLPNHSIFCVG